MKRMFIMLSFLITAPLLRGQDSSTAAGAFRQEIEENYKVLKADVDFLREANAAQAKTIEALKTEVSALRAQLAKPAGNFASQDDLKRVGDALRDAIEKVDKNRQDDNQLILKKIADLGKSLSATPVPRGTTRGGAPTDAPAASAQIQAAQNPDAPGFWYTIKSEDTFTKIAKYYKDNSINVTADEIARANPNVPETKLVVGKKLFIPAPKPAGGVR